MSALIYRYRKLKTVFTYLLLILVTTVSLFPLLWGIASSLRTDAELFRYAIPFSYRTLIPQEPTFAAYITLFTEFNFLQPLMNTLIVCAISILLSCTINSIAAYSFATYNFKFKKFLFGIILISFMIPFEAIALPLYGVVDGLGWINTRQGIIFPGIASGLVLFLFTQFFKDLPPSLMEAARVDGASGKTIFISIIMPLSIPVFITAGLMVFMAQWNAFLWPLLVARGPSIRMIQTALSDFHTEFGTLWSLLYAGSIVSALIPLLLFLPLQRFFVQGVTSSGIKG